ncbi:MAG TPA: hypothetical protein VJT11_13610 [Nitrospiraceae bacterium]|nr:hypothetical protein [Nitrospiraceae bacterium]
MSGHQSYRFGALILIGLCLQTGCAATSKEVQAVQVLYSAPEPIQSKRSGTISMKPLLDARELEERPFIGDFVHPFIPVNGGRVIVVRDGTSITTTITRGLSEVLKEAGYTPIFPDPSSASSNNTTIGAAVLEGEIREFWLQPWWTTTQVVRINLRLKDAFGERLLWEKELQGEFSKFIGVWNVAEFEEVIQKALDKVLRQAGKEFASEQFYLKVKDGN